MNLCLCVQKAMINHRIVGARLPWVPEHNGGRSDQSPRHYRTASNSLQSFPVVDILPTLNL